MSFSGLGDYLFFDYCPNLKLFLTENIEYLGVCTIFIFTRLLMPVNSKNTQSWTSHFPKICPLFCKLRFILLFYCYNMDNIYTTTNFRMSLKFSENTK